MAAPFHCAKAAQQGTVPHVGTRQDLNEAIAFTASGLVKADIETQPLENINAIFARMKKGEITGRVVLTIA